MEGKNKLEKSSARTKSEKKEWKDFRQTTGDIKFIYIVSDKTYKEPVAPIENPLILMFLSVKNTSNNDQKRRHQNIITDIVSEIKDGLKKETRGDHRGQGYANKRTLNFLLHRWKTGLWKRLVKKPKYSSCTRKK